MLKKFGLLYALIFAFLLGYVYTALVYNGIWFNLKSGLNSVPFYMWLIWLIVSFYLTLTLHELGHFFAFMIQGIKLRALYLTIFVFYKNEKGWKFTIKPKLWVLLGGLVVPDLGEIKRDEDYQKVAHQFGIALITAPIVTLSVLLLTWVLFIIMLYTSSNIGQIGIMAVMTLWITLLSLLYIYTFTLSNPMFYGDIVAYKKMKKDAVFRLAQIHQYQMFSLLESNETEIFLWHKVRDAIKKHTLHHHTTDIALYMAYIDGILHLNQEIDTQVDLKIQRLSTHLFTRSEQGITLLYEVCHYYYKTKRPDQAYRLFEFIQERASKKINENVLEYLKKRSMHIMHIAYDDLYLNDLKHITMGNTWIFEPILDLKEMLKDAHEKLTFVPYLTLVDLKSDETTSNLIEKDE
jgi:hypothetical protein